MKGMRKLRLGLVVGVLAAVLAVGTALAAIPQVDPSTVPHGFLISDSHVTNAPVNAFARVLDSPGGADLYTAHLSFSPGDSTGWHTHPGPAIHSIISGALTIYDVENGQCTAQTYTAGQTFIDPGFGHVHLAVDESSTVAVDFYVTFLNPHGVDSVSTPAAEPRQCVGYVE